MVAQELVHHLLLGAGMPRVAGPPLKERQQGTVATQEVLPAERAAILPHTHAHKYSRMDKNTHAQKSTRANTQTNRERDRE